MKPALHIRNLQFAWAGSRGYRIAVEELKVGCGERLLLVGPSGSGKTTLLNLIAGIAKPNSGVVEISGTDMAALTARHRDQLRADAIGLVFQQLNLIPYLTAVENACLPLRFSGQRRKNAGADSGREARRLLAAMGLGEDSISARAARLSIGQQQRVAAARALIGKPSLVLADEPTSALDAQSRQLFMDLLLSEAKRASASVVMVTHDLTLAPFFDRVWSIADHAAIGFNQ